MSNSISYRKEIDGLRAIAILPVVLFHAGFEIISGGFLGVDIFFVISGYLITSIIAADLSKERFSIVEFYERRARRILPALAVVTLTTSILGLIFLPSFLYKEFSQSLVAVSTFLSNVFFYQEGGYFGTKFDEMPMLHTWSLAVEEQFYVIFPIVMLLLWSKGKTTVLNIIFLITLFSVIYAQFLAATNQQAANFYLIFSRAWELLLGAIVALKYEELNNIKATNKNILSSLGFIIIIASLLLFDKSTLHPSLYTLIPILGTCLVISFSTSKNTAGKILCSRLLVRIGLVSYSIYLWHQPILALLKIKTIGTPEPYKLALAVILTYILAELSLKLIESPFRNRERFSRQSIFIMSGLTLSTMLFLGLLGHFMNGFPTRFNQEYLATVEHSPKREACHSSTFHYIEPNDACTYFGKNRSWAVIGDSHAVELSYALASKLEKQGNDEGVHHLSFSSCSPAINYESNNDACTRWARSSLTFLESSKAIRNVVIAYRHSFYLYGDHLDNFPKQPNLNPNRMMSNDYKSLDKHQARELYWNSFETMVTRIIKSGKKVYILYPVPELPSHVNNILTSFSIFDQTTTLDVHATTETESYKKRHSFILNKLDSLKYDNQVIAIKPSDALCTKTHCKTVLNNQALYFDDDHLSIYGASKILDQL